VILVKFIRRLLRRGWLGSGKKERNWEFERFGELEGEECLIEWYLAV